MRAMILAALLAGGVCTAFPACAAAAPGASYDIIAQRAKIARIEMRPDTSFLNREERAVVDLLIEAARIDYARMENGLRDLLAESIRLQGDGDYADTKAFFDRHARLDDDARAVLAASAAIPTDIQPVYPDRI